MSSSTSDSFNMGGGVKSLSTVVDPSSFGQIGNAGRGVSAQAVMLVLVVAVSGGLLFAMKKIGEKSSIDFGASYESFQPDTKLQADYERVMASLTSVQDPLDVALADFKQSPFAFRTTAAPANTDDPRPVASSPQSESPEQALARRGQQRKALIAGEFAKLTLHSVLGGRRPIARINDETVTVGDMVVDMFLVAAIDGRSVILTVDGQNYVLSMDQAPPGPGGKKK